MINLDIQILILFYSFISGVIFGIGFDIYRVLFRDVYYKVFRIIIDHIYWMVVGVLVFIFLLNTQYAILSFYTYFYILLGIIFYTKCISIFIYRIINNLVGFLLEIIRYIFKNLIYIISKVVNKKNY
ncbi:Spore cortex biosynthesis protein [Candidatus Arthromitus sp. SFB-mouse-NL]|uniref:spore cortex biosynthesis protein YabQ n=1 Tax=Candidatus Arthromitus sp. SFB-mouse-NL TaxID=1508644 RepID=UPI00049AA315|nr:spore cortex biosynthesis protein YabQ [Candidatus Arthromitus sp. SFB-mouse-NL]AID45472.1 Spore cortex biosynthesis protein [Candidatus Arthromitus sp. SFB-mouse-NL]